MRPGCRYVRVNLDIPAWLADSLSAIFLKEREPSRNKLIERILAGFLGYSDKGYIKKCKEEAKKEAKKKAGSSKT